MRLALKKKKKEANSVLVNKVCLKCCHQYIYILQIQAFQMHAVKLQLHFIVSVRTACSEEIKDRKEAVEQEQHANLHPS